MSRRTEYTMVRGNGIDIDQNVQIHLDRGWDLWSDPVATWDATGGFVEYA